MELSRKGRAEGYRASFLRSDGTEVSVEIAANLLLDAHGEVVGSVVIFREPSAPRSALQQKPAMESSDVQEALKESEERWHSIVNNIPDIIMTVSPEGKLQFINHTLPGVKPMGKHVLGSSVYDYVPKEYQEEMRSALQRVFNTGKVQKFETAGVGPDGTTSWYASHVAPIERDGKVIAAVMVSQDITERKRAEEALRDSEERYHRLIETAPDGIYTLSADDGSITSLNPAFEKITGWSIDEWVGKSFADIIHPDDLPLAIETFMKASSGETVKPYELRILSKSGEYVIGEFTSVPEIVGGKVVGEFGIARDVTERKQAEEELKAYQERLKDALTKLRVSYEELSTPVVQIWDHVLAIPLIGVLDTHRAKNVMEVLLNKIVEARAEVVVLDVTGVATMDTQVTKHLLQTAASTELLGAECVITGIRPEVAQAMIHIGVDFTRLNTKRDLQEGLKYALARMGHDVGGRG